MGEWKYLPSTSIPTSFNQAIMLPEVKIWIQFVCTQIVPTLNVSNVNTFRAIILYAILQNKEGIPHEGNTTNLNYQRAKEEAPTNTR
ncbi:hypothetical protein PVK06_028124 [Gossypium arboreum]|uniref:Uncharacterized protein n=1 Tax=Gossypium arboreum TaxID=29729 RepID=A0ABR0P242_GOSAR|nr:hypothetical protein PVK06_028124 [Gossypium arboreum]